VLDTNVFVFAIEFPNSNCEGVTAALALGLFDGYVTDRVLYEGMTYFKRHHSRDDAARFHRLATTACTWYWMRCTNLAWTSWATR
jgi:hypothetical protein